MSVLLLAGAPAAGKTTVAELVCAARPRAALVEVDALRRLQRRPAPAEPWEGEAGAAQYRLGIANACLLARSFLAAGCDVVLVDVAPPEMLGRFRDGLAGAPLFTVLVRAEPSELVRRDAGRAAVRGGADPAGWPVRLVALADRLDLRAGRYDRTLETTGRDAQDCADDLAAAFDALRPSAPRATTASAGAPPAGGGRGRAAPG